MITEHDFGPYVFTEGPRKGRVARDRRCTRCWLWETPISRQEPCADPLGTPEVTDGR